MTLVLSNLSATEPFVPPPTPPDFAECDSWYSSPGKFPELLLEDCRNAWRELPQGSDPVVWYINGLPPGLPPRLQYALPLRRAHGKLSPILIATAFTFFPDSEHGEVTLLGTCEIVLSASGKYVEDKNRLQAQAVPDDLRDIALYTIEKCLDDEKEGGYSTHQFANVANWITSPNTVFPGNLNLPARLTFFTAMIWNPADTLEDFEPGSRDARSAVELRRALQIAKGRAAPGSTLARSLQARQQYVRGSEIAIINHGGHESEYFWWSGSQPSRTLSQVTGK